MPAVHVIVDIRWKPPGIDDNAALNFRLNAKGQVEH
jgi:hypothetical protein